MRNILIVDNDQASLVMTSECCKESSSNVKITIANSGQDCIGVVSQNRFDLIILDFNLPDCDGISLTKYLRNMFKGPIIISAYPSKIVEEAIYKELFPYQDSQMWLKKPIRKNILKPVISYFLISKNPTTKTIPLNLKVAMGKRKIITKKMVSGETINLSIEHAFIKYTNQFEWKKGENIYISINKKPELHNKDSFIKAEINWANSRNKRLHLSFPLLSENEYNLIDKIIKNESIEKS